jgi:hypothetical protein
MPDRIFAEKNQDGNMPVDGIWSHEIYGDCESEEPTEYFRVDIFNQLRDQNAALVEWIMARDWGEERDSILEQIEALQEMYRTESAEAGKLPDDPKAQ